MLPTYIETEDSDCADAWLERYGRRLPLRRIVEECAEAAAVSPVHPTVAAVEAARAALPEGDGCGSLLGSNKAIAQTASRRALTALELAELERVGLCDGTAP